MRLWPIVEDRDAWMVRAERRAMRRMGRGRAAEYWRLLAALDEPYEPPPQLVRCAYCLQGWERAADVREHLVGCEKKPGV